MQMFLDIIRQSLATLWVHKLRSFLTMFGIAWGVGSLLLLVGLGEGFRSGQAKQLATLGQDIMFCFPGRIPAVEGSRQSGQTYHFTYDDYLAIKNEAQTSAKADLSSLSSMLQARWKTGSGGPPKPEPARAGQVRSFRIVKLDRATKKLEVELA